MKIGAKKVNFTHLPMNDDPSLYQKRLDPFTVFCNRNRKDIVNDNPNMTELEISEKLNELWSSKTDAERQEYQEYADEVPKESIVTPPPIFEPPLIQPIHDNTSDVQKFLYWLGTQALQIYDIPNPSQITTDKLTELNKFMQIFTSY